MILPHTIIQGVTAGRHSQQQESAVDIQKDLRPDAPHIAEGPGQPMSLYCGRIVAIREDVVPSSKPLHIGVHLFPLKEGHSTASHTVGGPQRRLRRCSACMQGNAHALATDSLLCRLGRQWQSQQHPPLPLTSHKLHVCSQNSGCQGYAQLSAISHTTRQFLHNSRASKFRAVTWHMYSFDAKVPPCRRPDDNRPYLHVRSTWALIRVR